jgi:hypothetical protein
VQRSNTPAGVALVVDSRSRGAGASSSAALRPSAYVPGVRLLGGTADAVSAERQASFLPILAITDGRSVPPQSRGGGASPPTSSMDGFPMMRAVVRGCTNRHRSSGIDPRDGCRLLRLRSTVWSDRTRPRRERNSMSSTSLDRSSSMPGRSTGAMRNSCASSSIMRPALYTHGGSRVKGVDAILAPRVFARWRCARPRTVDHAGGAAAPRSATRSTCRVGCDAIRIQRPHGLPAGDMQFINPHHVLHARTARRDGARCAFMAARRRARPSTRAAAGRRRARRPAPPRSRGSPGDRGSTSAARPAARHRRGPAAPARRERG